MTLRDAKTGKFISSVKNHNEEGRLVSVSELDKYLSTHTHCYVKPVDLTVPVIKNRYNDVLQYEFNFVNFNTIKLCKINMYGNLLYVSILSSDKVQRHLYLDKDYKFMLFDNEVDIQKNDDIFNAYIMENISIYLAHRCTIGSDPEIFVQNESGDVISVFLFLGSKEKPDYTTGLANDGYHQNFGYYGHCPMYWDGFQAEFTTKSNTCLGHHIDSIAAGLHGVYTAARAKFPKSKLSLRSVYHISYEMLMGADEEHVAFGCMPSFNAYGMKVEMPPAREVPFRSS